jgi:hypothetical protein
MLNRLERTTPLEAKVNRTSKRAINSTHSDLARLHKPPSIKEVYMLNPSNVDFCSEYYLVEKAIEVMTKIEGVDRKFRIEALHGPESVIPYTTRCYIRMEIAVPQSNAEPISVWAHYDLPSTAKHSADQALEQALGFLRERSSPCN